jgi:hypothetical protein
MQSVKNVRELATIRRNFQSIVIFRDAKAFLGITLPGTARKFILKYSGALTCGNDLSKIQITERFAVNQVRITVPSAKLFDSYADMDNIKVYDQSAGLFTSIKLEDQNREIAANLEEMRQETLRDGILRQANENTRSLLTSLAASLGMNAEIVFEDVPAPEFAAAEKKASIEPESVPVEEFVDREPTAEEENTAPPPALELAQESAPEFAAAERKASIEPESVLVEEFVDREPTAEEENTAPPPALDLARESELEFAAAEKKASIEQEFVLVEERVDGEPTAEEENTGPALDLMEESAPEFVTLLAEAEAKAKEAFGCELPFAALEPASLPVRSQPHED